MDTPVFRFGVYGPPVDAIDGGPDWYDWYNAQYQSPAYLAAYGSPWTSWTNSDPGSIHASVDQTRYPATPDQVKRGQYQSYPAYTTHDPITCTVAGLDPGTYKVVIYAREHWAPFTTAGQRVFTAAANGGNPVTVDLAGDFGPLTLGAVEIETTVDASGDIDITFVGVIEAPTWDAIEILWVESDVVLDVPAADVAVAGHAPAVAGGAGVQAPAAVVAVSGLAPSLFTGAAVPVPAAVIGVFGWAPYVGETLVARPTRTSGLRPPALSTAARVAASSQRRPPALSTARR